MTFFLRLCCGWIILETHSVVKKLSGQIGESSYQFVVWLENIKPENYGKERNMPRLLCIIVCHDIDWQYQPHDDILDL